MKAYEFDAGRRKFQCCAAVISPLLWNDLCRISTKDAVLDVAGNMLN